VPARPCQSGAQTAAPQPVAEKASSLPSFDDGDVCDPTYTMPFTTVGESMIWARLVEVHSGVVQRDWPHPVAGYAHRRPSEDPM